MRTRHPEGPLNLARVLATREADAPLRNFAPALSTIVSVSWFLGAALMRTETTELMNFVLKGGSVALCMAEALEVASRIGPPMALKAAGLRGIRAAGAIKKRLDPLTDLFLWVSSLLYPNKPSHVLIVLALNRDRENGGDF